MNDMKKRIIYLCIAVGALAVSSCSSEEYPDNPVGKDSIRLSAVVPNRSRANPTTTASIQDFVVYAFTEKSTLMEGVKVYREGGSWTYSPAAYWPVSPVNFYAFSPDITSSPDITGSAGGNIPDYVSDGTVDLLYSTKIGVVQQAAPVELNFRHAMSNINVLLSSQNPRIQVVLRHMSLNNIYIQGTFDFPQKSTVASTPDVVGKWSMLKNLNRMMLFYAITATDSVVLTPVATNYTLNNLKTGFVIPQPLTEVTLDNGKYVGSYISVECEIYDTATGVKLWPNSNTPEYMLVEQSECGRIIYPTTSSDVTAWLPGHVYNYNIRINNPTVLDRIEFDVNVDDYIIDSM